MNKKGILVINMPENCYSCSCYISGDIGEYDKCGATEEMVFGDGVPEWCPVKPMPEKIEHKSRQGLLQEKVSLGWNLCIDEILGEDENE